MALCEISENETLEYALISHFMLRLLANFINFSDLTYFIKFYIMGTYDYTG